ncbi:MAG: DUF2007 domain-containing protein [Acidobacteriia bacterium]|nr:DUF2007 domain-containing protein [Terriglobia bacterium]
MNYCPLCDAEYREGFSICSDCGVHLVSSEHRRLLRKTESKEPLDMVWKTGDPVALSQAIVALCEAGIRHDVKATHDQFVFELGMPRPKYEIRVFRSDAARARELLEPIYQSPPFALGEPMEEEAREAQEAEKLEERRAAVWNPKQATAEIWSGEDAGLARTFEDCLRENRIGVRREGAKPGTLRLFVMPADEPAAREILREIREGSPPR